MEPRHVGRLHSQSKVKSHDPTTVCVCCKYPTPIKLHALLPLLDQYPNKRAAQVLRSGFSEGFRLGYMGPRVSRESRNLRTVSQLPEKVKEKIDKEKSLGRIVGPFQKPPIENLIISPIGLVPKSQPGKYRMIQHLSFPDGDSVNDWIDREYCAVQYTHFDKAVEGVIRVGKGALMAKEDIESAFRLLPVHPEDFGLLGIKLGSSYFIDKALPMGASCSPSLFEKFSTFVEWVARTAANTENIVHYADDFLIVGKSDIEGSNSCQKIVEIFHDVCDRLGIPLAKEKAVGPSTEIVYLGLKIDSIKQEISVPEEKLQTIIGKVEKAVQQKKLTLRELQSLIGSLSFVCKAVAPGRPFIRRLIDLTCGVDKSWHKIRLSEGAKGDLRMWLVFLREFNGISVFQDQLWVGAADLQLYTDASGEIGFGGFLSGSWFQDRWPEIVLREGRSIAWKEFFPIVVAVVLWGHKMQGKRIMLRSDNTAVVEIINKQTSKCPRIMRLMRFFVLQCLKQNVSFKASHISGKSNHIADALSRFQMQRFRKMAPTASQAGFPVPNFLWEI